MDVQSKSWLFGNRTLSILNISILIEIFIEMLIQMNNLPDCRIVTCYGLQANTDLRDVKK